MKFIMLVIALGLNATAEDALKTANLNLLANPATRQAEVARLADCDGKKQILTNYRFHSAPQANGKAPLRFLAASYDFDFQRNRPPINGYLLEKPEELFGKTEDIPAAAIFAPELSIIQDSVILFFDSVGKEVRPFEGNNFINHGYCCDFNKDGILERADTTNYSLSDRQKRGVEVFELQTVEAEPKMLLEVVFNDHRWPKGADEWIFTCFDEQGDGFIEIAFGPKTATNDEEQRQITFRWDPETKHYSAAEIPENAHIRVVSKDEKLAELADAGELEFPRVADPKSKKEPKPEAQYQPQAPYVFKSLKDASDEEMAAFFQGKEHHDSFSGTEDSFPNRLPDEFWNMNPKAAALALADANRTPSHRHRWKLAIDDRGDISPPSSGWLAHQWGSSGCYSYSSHLFVLRFGVEKPTLTVFGYNSIGVVGRNPWADQPAHNARHIELTKNEARFFADTIFWLDRVRSWSPGNDEGVFSSSSTADGFATLSLYPDEVPAREIASGTVWAMNSISASWVSTYDHDTFANLAEFLIGDKLPEFLDDRWINAPDIGRQSLTTPTDERLAPRVDDNGRQQLTDAFTDILKSHARDPFPAQALSTMVAAIGDEAMAEHLPALERLYSEIPEPTSEDEEFEILSKRFAHDHFGQPKRDAPADHQKDYKRLEKLREKRKFQVSAVLRAPLQAAIKKLRLAENPAYLMQAVNDETPESQWALSRLRRADLDTWTMLMTDQFRAGNKQEKRIIFDTLSAGNPDAASKLIQDFTPKESEDLSIEIANHRLAHDQQLSADESQTLMELVRDRKMDFIRRGQAMEILAETELGDELAEEFSKLLVSEITKPQEGDYGMNTLRSAISSLAQLRATPEHIELIVSLDHLGYSEFNAAIRALHHLVTDKSKRNELMTPLLERHSKNAKGMMNDLFLTCLAHDLRSQNDMISGFSTQSAEIKESDRAHSYSNSDWSPEGQRYHLAREVTALWSETDPKTLARMWACFIAAHPSEFEEIQDASSTNSILRELAAEKLRAISSDQRRQAIEAAQGHIKIPDYAQQTENWLKSLSDS